MRPDTGDRRNRRRRSSCIAALLLSACLIAGGAGRAPARARPLVLVNGTLVDGSGLRPVRNGAVVVVGRRIVAAGPRDAIKLPQGARTIDAAGRTILPGFVNAHVHAAYESETLRAWARDGVTTVRDLGWSADYRGVLAFRDRAGRDPRAARLVAVGPFVTVPDGYPIAVWGNTALTVTSPDTARRAVDRLLEDGVDIVKIGLESGAVFGEQLPILAPEVAKAIVETAHEHGTVASAHVTSAADLARALDAGVDDVAHMVTDRVPDHLLRRMVDERVAWVPTLELWRGVGMRAHVRDNLRRFVRAGGVIALGTDYSGAPNVDFDLGMPMREIRLMRAAGMTAMQIIVAATRNAARVCNLQRELGTVERGKVADLIVVEGDPFDRLESLANVTTVVHAGVVIRDVPVRRR